MSQIVKIAQLANTRKMKVQPPANHATLAPTALLGLRRVCTLLTLVLSTQHLLALPPASLIMNNITPICVLPTQSGTLKQNSVPCLAGSPLLLVRAQFVMQASM